MGGTSTLANMGLYDAVTGGQLFAKIFFTILLVIGIVVLIISIYKRYKNNWHSSYLVALCAVIICYSAAMLYSLFFPYAAGNRYAEMLKYSCIMYIPALMLFQIWRNTSYKKLELKTIIGVLIVPVIATVYTVCTTLFTKPGGNTAFMLGIVQAAGYIYSFVIIIRCYLLCFNVFYQMPQHLRRPSRKMLISISALLAYLVIELLWNNILDDGQIKSNPIFSVIISICGPIALMLVVYYLFNAMYYGLASNIVVTSRDMVFGILSTMVLVLNGQYHILDWNRKNKNGSLPLPDPIYQEKLNSYIHRTLTYANGYVSTHDKNIFTLLDRGRELHYLMKIENIRTQGGDEGVLVQFTEITAFYGAMRSLIDTAMTDQLTGLINRNGYLHTVQFLQLQEHNMPLLVVLGDANNLKFINDNYGHLAGDSLLILISRIIDDNKPQGAYASRIGGDEYVMLVPRADERLAVEFINRVNQVCWSIHDDRYGTPSISWGYAVMRSIHEDYNQVMHAADQMMYKVKKQHHKFSNSGFIRTHAQQAQPSNSPDTTP